MFGWAITFLIIALIAGVLGFRRRCGHLYRNGKDHLHRGNHLVLGFGDHWPCARTLRPNALAVRRHPFFAKWLALISLIIRRDNVTSVGHRERPGRHCGRLAI
jgi:hypothetical protein